MIGRLLSILFAFSSIILPAVAQSPIVGVLEDVPGAYVGQSDVREVRVVFRKNGHEWIAFPSKCPDQACLKTAPAKFPRQMIWNIGFDGKLLGQVSARTPNALDFYADIGLQKITSKAPIPTVGEKLAEFGGYADASVFRPLVADSEPYFSDPNGWKPSRLTAAEVQSFRNEFRQRFPKLCKINEDETKLEPFSYRDRDIRIVKAYGSRKGWKIARLHIEGAVDCGDNEGGFQIDDPWFAMDHQGQFRYLGSGMWLVDAGDYDNDGSSEIVFSIDRDNRGGYMLFYDDFKDHAVFEFSYH